MTEQTTQIGRVTVKPHEQVLIQYSDKVTGSPQAKISLHADFREVAPRRGGKTLAERLDEAYRNDYLEPQEQEFLELAKEHFSRLDDE